MFEDFSGPYNSFLDEYDSIFAATSGAAPSATCVADDTTYDTLAEISAALDEARVQQQPAAAADVTALFEDAPVVASAAAAAAVTVTAAAAEHPQTSSNTVDVTASGVIENSTVDAYAFYKVAEQSQRSTFARALARRIVAEDQTLAAEIAAALGGVVTFEDAARPFGATTTTNAPQAVAAPGADGTSVKALEKSLSDEQKAKDALRQHISGSTKRTIEMLSGALKRQAELTEDLEKAKETAAVLDAEKLELEAKIASALSDAASLKKQAEDLDESNSGAKYLISEKLKMIESTEKRLEEIRRSESELARSRSELAAAIVDKQTCSAKLDRSLANKRAKLVRLEKTIAANEIVREHLTEDKKLADSLADDIASKKNELEHLEASISDTRKTLDASVRDAAEKRADLEALQMQLTAASSSVATAASDLASKQSAVMALDGEIAAKRTMTEALDVEIVSKQSASKTLDDEIESKQTMSKILSDEIVSKQTMSKSLDRTLAGTTGKIYTKRFAANALGGAIAAKQTEVEAIGDEFAAKQARLPLEQAGENCDGEEATAAAAVAAAAPSEADVQPALDMLPLPASGHVSAEAEADVGMAGIDEDEQQQQQQQQRSKTVDSSAISYIVIGDDDDDDDDDDTNESCKPILSTPFCGSGEDVQHDDQEQEKKQKKKTAKRPVEPMAAEEERPHKKSKKSDEEEEEHSHKKHKKSKKSKKSSDSDEKEHAHKKHKKSKKSSVSDEEERPKKHKKSKKPSAIEDEKDDKEEKKEDEEEEEEEEDESGILTVPWPDEALRAAEESEKMGVTTNIPQYIIEKLAAGRTKSQLSVCRPFAPNGTRLRVMIQHDDYAWTKKTVKRVKFAGGIVVENLKGSDVLVVKNAATYKKSGLHKSANVVDGAYLKMCSFSGQLYDTEARFSWDIRTCGACARDRKACL